MEILTDLLWDQDMWWIINWYSMQYADLEGDFVVAGDNLEQSTEAIVPM